MRPMFKKNKRGDFVLVGHSGGITVAGALGFFVDAAEKHCWWRAWVCGRWRGAEW